MERDRSMNMQLFGAEANTHFVRPLSYQLAFANLYTIHHGGEIQTVVDNRKERKSTEARSRRAKMVIRLETALGRGWVTSRLAHVQFNRSSADADRIQSIRAPTPTRTMPSNSINRVRLQRRRRESWWVAKERDRRINTRGPVRLQRPI